MNKDEQNAFAKNDEYCLFGRQDHGYDYADDKSDMQYASNFPGLDDDQPE